jgi:hypothetical protein
MASDLKQAAARFSFGKPDGFLVFPVADIALRNNSACDIISVVLDRRHLVVLQSM